MARAALKLAGIVVWHNPKPEHFATTKILSSLLEKLYIIDNSSRRFDFQNECLPSSIHYTWMEKNTGIAAALNYGCTLSLLDKFEYVLTLDQDTALDKPALDIHIADASREFLNPRLAIVGASITREESPSINSIIEKSSVITSGNILRLSAWSEIGGFNEELFIDQVDHEFCYRLREHGHKVILNTKVLLNHTVGDPISKEIMGYRITSSNHHWVRRYYQVRNSLYLRRRFPKEAKPLIFFLKDLRDIFIGILILENNRCAKLRAMMSGFLDYHLNKYGSWDDNHLGKH
jgi:rhamnosyltransferase